MQLTGKHILQAQASSVWNVLMDTDALARIVPGISRLERTSEHAFRSFLEIKMGPINAAFSGDALMEDVKEQKGFTLKVQQNSTIGNANAVIKISLDAIGENQTEVAFNGDVQLSGLLSAMGQTMFSGASGTLTKQFFVNLEKELNS